MKLHYSGLYFLIILFFHALPSIAQIEQGRWLIDGSLGFINRGDDEPEAENLTTLQLELGYLITRRIAVGAGLDLELERLNANVEHSLWGRYYLLPDIPKISPFTGLHWEREVQRLQRTQNRVPTKASEDRLFWTLGFNYPIHRNLSVEGIYYFGLFEYRTVSGNSGITDGDSFLDIRLRLLLDSDQEVETFDLATAFSSGQWMIGGFAEFNPPEAVGFRRFLKTNIRPMMARFMLSRLLVGGRLNLNYVQNIRDITTGLSPFVRYYLPLGGNKALFAEGSYGYNHILKQERPKLYISDHEFIRQFGLGYAIFINSRVSLEGMLSQLYSRRKFNFSTLTSQSSFTLTNSDILFTVGLQFFLNPGGS